MTRRLVVLVSGNGSNLQAILDACAAGELNATVAAVVSNKRDAYGLERARLAGVPAIARPRPLSQPREQYDAELADLVASYGPDLVVLAGWMRVLGNAFLTRFPGQVVNGSPSIPARAPVRRITIPNGGHNALRVRPAGLTLPRAGGLLRGRRVRCCVEGFTHLSCE